MESPRTDHSTAPPPPWAIYGALVIVQLLFGANYIAAKVAFLEVTPLGLVFFRAWGTVAVLGAALALRRRPRRPNAPRLQLREFGELLLYSLLGISINQVAFLEGLDRSSATNAAIILVTIPVVTLAFAVLLKRERATLAGVAGITLGLAGALIIILPRGGVTIASSAMLGNGLLLICAASYSLFLVLARSILVRHDTLAVVTWMFVLAGVTLTPVGFAGARAAIVHGVSPAGWAAVAFVTVGATAIPYLFNSWALVTAKSSVVAVFVLIQPIVAAVLGRIYLGEHLGPHAALAGALIVAGVMASAWSRRGR